MDFKDLLGAAKSRITTPSQFTQPAARPVFELWGQTKWEPIYKIVGDSYRQKQIISIVGRQIPEQGIKIEATFNLVPEPTNAHDRWAVRVDTGGLTVGYIPKEDARGYFEVLARVVAAGWQPTVRGTIFAQPSYSRPGEIYSAIRLDLAPAHLIAPLNKKPDGNPYVLPVGGTVQVSGEEKRMDSIVPWIRPEGAGAVWVTLHRVVEETSRTTRTVVGVSIDGREVGTLTPRMSADFLPVLDALDGSGRPCAARAVVKGNALKADVSLRASKAGELTSEQSRELLNSSTGNGIQAQAPAAAVNPPAGWYSDPENHGVMRWWDGNTWTEHRQPVG